MGFCLATCVAAPLFADAPKISLDLHVHWSTNSKVPKEKIQELLSYASVTGLITDDYSPDKDPTQKYFLQVVSLVQQYPQQIFGICGVRLSIESPKFLECLQHPEMKGIKIRAESLRNRSNEMRLRKLLNQSKGKNPFVLIHLYTDEMKFPYGGEKEKIVLSEIRALLNIASHYPHNLFVIAHAAFGIPKALQEVGFYFREHSEIPRNVYTEISASPDAGYLEYQRELQAALRVFGYPYILYGSDRAFLDVEEFPLFLSITFDYLLRNPSSNFATPEEKEMVLHSNGIRFLEKIGFVQQPRS